MKRTSNTFSVLQATAVILSLAIVLWSLGLPSFNFVEAANVTTVSDTLSDAAPGVGANHTIVFTTPTGAANNTAITIDFTDGTFDTTGVLFSDVDVATSSGEFSLAADCTGSEMASAAFAGDILTVTFCLGDGGLLAADATTTIKIGTNATNQTTGVNQITNAAAGSYQIPISVGGGVDTGETRVAIVETVLVTASVDTLFTFSVAGVAGAQTVNTADTTGGPTTATTIPFGEIDAGTASTAAQDLSVTTNAKNGFIVTVIADGQLNSTTGADIDGFRNGNFNTTAVAWEGPANTLGDEDAYGHWGITSDDAALGSGLTNPFNAGGGGDRFVSASTSPVEVFRHTEPTNGTVTGEGTTRVGYKVEIGSLQEAAEDYQAVLTYIATPIF